MIEQQMYVTNVMQKVQKIKMVKFCLLSITLLVLPTKNHNLSQMDSKRNKSQKMDDEASFSSLLLR